MKNTIIILALTVITSCTSCNGKKSDNSSNTIGQSGKTINKNQQLNISILLDLSDRIDPQKYPEKPEHFERDIANIKSLTDYFVKDMEKRGAYMAKGRIKVIFSPKPQDPNVDLIAQKLDIDLSILDPKQKKEIHDNLTTTFSDNLASIYKAIIKEKKWIGSDIWRFFKNDVKDFCIAKDSNYRNILIILTDGYIYHKDSKDKNSNRFAYILPENISQFRSNPNWEKEIEKKDFGLISKRTDLEDLEILVLEISPSPTCKNDEDIIKVVLNKWFKEMRVKKVGLYNSELPELTKSRINNFIK